jgi:hypothetical protein
MTTSETDDLEIESDPIEHEPIEPTRPHLARCATCGNGLTIQPMPSGHGFTIIAFHGFSQDTTFGVGPTGFPVCPEDGHGEMHLADEQLPTAEAFAEAQRLQAAAAPSQPHLPGVVLPFNFQGAYLELEEKAVEVDRLHADYKEAAEEAKTAKKAWDKAAELYTKMALELRRRRREKEQQPADDLLDASEREQTNLVRCKWEQEHPGEACPICGEGEPECARDSEAHVSEVALLLESRAIEEVREELEFAAVVIAENVIRSWTPDQRDEVLAWAKELPGPRQDQDARASMLANRPAILGTGHVAAVPGEAVQTCEVCGVCLLRIGDDDVEDDAYLAGTIVGVDCEGPAKPEPSHHYPEKKKRGRKAAKAS